MPSPGQKQHLPYKSSSFKASAHSPVASYCSLTPQDVTLPSDDSDAANDIDTQELLERQSREGDLDASVALGQFYLTRGYLAEALAEFRRISEKDKRAFYQHAVMVYDGLGTQPNCKRAVEMMKGLCSEPDSMDHVASCALYNLGRAHFEGHGCRQSDEEAERLWLLAANDGQAGGCVKAMSVLGMFYSRFGEPRFDLKKAYFWHQEATGNGSVESQGALGVMLEYGLGVKRNEKSSFFCYKRAAEKGNLFAMGNLAKYYYVANFYNHCVTLAERLSSVDNIATAARDSGCSEHLARKGVALGCFIYARCYELGIGLEKSRETAAQLYKKAAAVDIDTVSELHEQLSCGGI